MYCTWYLAEEGETTHLCKCITDFYAIVWNVHFCLKGAQDLRNMCKFDQYLHTLRKSGTNTYAICVYLIHIYTLCIKGTQRFTQHV